MDVVKYHWFLLFVVCWDDSSDSEVQHRVIAVTTWMAVIVTRVHRACTVRMDFDNCRAIQENIKIRLRRRRVHRATADGSRRTRVRTCVRYVQPASCVPVAIDCPLRARRVPTRTPTVQ